MTSSDIYTFIILSALIGWGSKVETVCLIDDVGVCSSHYPQQYMDTPIWVKKVYGIHHRSIPKYYYYKLMVSVLLTLLGPVNIFVYWICGCSPIVEGILIWIHICLGLIDMITS